MYPTSLAAAAAPSATSSACLNLPAAQRARASAICPRMASILACTAGSCGTLTWLESSSTSAQLFTLESPALRSLLYAFSTVSLSAWASRSASAVSSLRRRSRHTMRRE